MKASEKVELRKIYEDRKAVLRRRYAHLDWNLSRFDFPFEQIVKMVWTPDDAWLYSTFFIEPDLDFIMPKEKGWFIAHSARITHQRRKGICSDRSVSAYGLLSEEYEPRIVCLTGGEPGHAMTVYKENGKYGSLSNAVRESMVRRDAEYDSLIALLRTYNWQRYTVYNWKEIYPNFMTQTRLMRFRWQSTDDVRPQTPVWAMEF